MPPEMRMILDRVAPDVQLARRCWAMSEPPGADAPPGFYPESHR